MTKPAVVDHTQNERQCHRHHHSYRYHQHQHDGHHHRHHHHHHRHWQAPTALRVFVLTAMLLISPGLCQEAPVVKEGQSNKAVQESFADVNLNSNNGNDMSDAARSKSIFNEMDTNHDVSLSLSEFTDNFHTLRQKIDAIRDIKASVRFKPNLKKGFWSGFSTSTMMIIATEIGDKTFFIAAVLSMRNSRYSVFFGSVLALMCMTILSTMMGLILPSFLPKSYTHVIAGILFFYFGIKLIYDSRSMENKVSDELEEVEEELLSTRKKEDSEQNDHTPMSIPASKSSSLLRSDIESMAPDNSRSATPTTSNSTSAVEYGQSNPTSPNNNNNNNNNNNGHEELDTSSGANDKKKSATKSIFLQAYILTFLAEWGDRSQIATIALAADRDPYGVTFGACFGHALCTGMAVVGGRMLASKISEKTVSFWGGFIFLAFGFHSLFFDS